MVQTPSLLTRALHDGSANSTSVVSTDNFARIGKPTKNNATGGWRIVATLKADGTADDYGLRSWEVGGNDPASLFIDADASDLSIIFETSSATDDTWSVSSNARAVLVFTAEQPQPAQPAQPGITDVIEAAATIDYTLKNAEDGTYDGAVAIGSDSRMANITSVYWNEGLSAWAVDVTLRQLGTPADYGIDVPAFFAGDYALDTASSKFVTTLVYQDGAWVRAAGATASLVFTEQVAQAPAFDINSELLVYGTVTYDLKYADGTAYENNTYLVSDDNIASVGTPYQTADGCWAVDVTLKDTAMPDAYQVPDWALRDGTWALDAAASGLTLTFRTLRADGTTWYCSGADRANLVFVEQTGDTGEQPGGDGEQPGDTTGPDAKPGDVQPGDGNAQGGTSQTDGNRGGSGTKAKGAEGADKNGLPQTGDPATLGMVAFAAAGAATLAAGAELLRRRA